MTHYQTEQRNKLPRRFVPARGEGLRAGPWNVQNRLISRSKRRPKAFVAVLIDNQAADRSGVMTDKTRCEHNESTKPNGRAE